MIMWYANDARLFEQCRQVLAEDTRQRCYPPTR